VTYVGGVFEHELEQQVRAVMTQAVDDVNSSPHLLPDIQLHVDLEFVPAYDSFAASRAGKRFTLVYCKPTPTSTLHVTIATHDRDLSIRSRSCVASDV